MEITDIRIRKIDEAHKLKALVSVTFDNDFVVHDVRIIENSRGLYVSMPSKRSSDGEYRDIAHPINLSFRERLQSAILSQYEAIQVVQEEDALE